MRPLRKPRQDLTFDQIWNSRIQANLACSTEVIYSRFEKQASSFIEKNYICNPVELWSWIFFVQNFLLPRGPESNPQAQELKKNPPANKAIFISFVSTRLEDRYPEFLKENQDFSKWEDCLWRYYSCLLHEDSLIRVEMCKKFPGLNNQLSIFVNRRCTASSLSQFVWGQVIPVNFRSEEEWVELSHTCHSVWKDEVQKGILVGPVSLCNFDPSSIFEYGPDGKSLWIKQSDASILLKENQEIFLNYGTSHHLDTCECDQCREDLNADFLLQINSTDSSLRQTIFKKQDEPEKKEKGIEEKKRQQQSEKRSKQRARKRYISSSELKDIGTKVFDSLKSMNILERQTAFMVSKSLYALELQRLKIVDDTQDFHIEQIVNKYWKALNNGFPSDDVPISNEDHKRQKIEPSESSPIVEDIQKTTSESTEPLRGETTPQEKNLIHRDSCEETLELDLKDQHLSLNSIQSYKKMVKELEAKLKLEIQWSHQLQKNLLAEQAKREEIEQKYEQLQTQFEQLKNQWNQFSELS